MKKLRKNIFSLFVLAIIGLAVYEILKLDVLPEEYLLLFIGLEIALFLLAFIFYNIKTTFSLFLGFILYLVLIVGNIGGYFYLSKVNNYINENLAKDTYTIKTTYYLLANKDNKNNKLKEIKKDSTIYYYKYSKSVSKVKKELSKYNCESIDNVVDSLKSINDKDEYLLLSKADYDYLFDNMKIDSINKEDYKIIHELNVNETIKSNKETPNSYNIYINGVDHTGVMRDYNLLVTINTKTHRVLFTYIPRDYYINIPQYNIKDTVMCLGSVDSSVSKDALEKLFNTRIDYTINVNTNGIIGIVNTLDGIEFCTKSEFYTTHSLVTDTYDDSKGKKLYVPRGCANYNGIEILTIMRERNDIIGRNRHIQIIMNIGKKLISTSSLTNYNQIISSFDGLYTTDMNDKTLKDLIKTIVDDINFKIEDQSVEGNESIDTGHLGVENTWVITPNMDTVDAASKYINMVLEGE